eukprot:5960752-Amphidinium_carterae.1
MSGLVTILCHAECLGTWASFWAPCRGRWPFATKFIAGHKMPEGGAGGVDGLRTSLWDDLVSRNDVCGWRWHMNGR